MATRLDFDHVGLVMNGPSTFATIGSALIAGGAVSIEWTDDHHTKLSILFAIPQASWPAQSADMSHCGLHPLVPTKQALFVAVRHPGAGLAAFWLTDVNWKPLHPDYIGEKLFHVEQAGLNPTYRKVANLVNGVIATWRRLHHLDIGREEETADGTQEDATG